MAMSVPQNHATTIPSVRHHRKAAEFLERLLTCARQRCSYVGCDRLRHTGPCSETAEATRLEHAEKH